MFDSDTDMRQKGVSLLML